MLQGMQRYQIWLLTGAALAGLSVATGAFGAHGLEKALKKDTSLDAATVERRLDNWETAARYQMYTRWDSWPLGSSPAAAAG
jgi:uncharacterized membrane protein YgdD (TMEM256/DUF423 family)